MRPSPDIFFAHTHAPGSFKRTPGRTMRHKAGYRSHAKEVQVLIPTMLQSKHDPSTRAQTGNGPTWGNRGNGKNLTKFDQFLDFYEN